MEKGHDWGMRPGQEGGLISSVLDQPLPAEMYRICLRHLARSIVYNVLTYSGDSVFLNFSNKKLALAEEKRPCSWLRSL